MTLTAHATEQTMSGMPDRLLTVKQVADRLECGLRKAWQLVRDGDIPHRRIGRHVRVPESVLDEYIRQDLRRGIGKDGASTRIGGEEGGR